MKNQRIENNNRIWELDIIRGILVLAILSFHLYLTVQAFCIDGYYTNLDSYAYVNATDPLHFWFDWGADGEIHAVFDLWGLLDPVHSLSIATLFIMSGITCQFSRDNFRKSLQLLAAAFLVSGFSLVIREVSGEDHHFIRFGILHCYGFSRLIYVWLLEKRSNRTLIILALAILAVGYYLRAVPVIVETSLLYPFGFYEAGVSARDYWPLLPYLGWFLLGVILGRTVYRERKSLIRGKWQGQGTRWLQTLGRYSGPIYFFHIFGYTAVFLLMGWILNLF